MNYLDQIQSDLQKKNPLYIKVKVFSKSPKTEIFDQLEDETYKIKVAAKPIRGQANATLLRYFIKSLKLSDAQIVSGGRDKIKLIRLNS